MHGLRNIRLTVVLVLLAITAIWVGSARPPRASAGYLPSIRFYEGSRPYGRLLFTLVRLPYRVPTWGIFYGAYSYSFYPPYIYNDQVIFDGPTYYDDYAFRFDRDTVYRGGYIWGEPIMHLEGDRLFLGGNTVGEIVFTLHNDRVFAGANTGGAIVATADRRITSFPGPTPLVVGLVLGNYLPPIEPPLPPPPPPPPPGVATATPTATRTATPLPAVAATPTETRLPPPAATATPTATPTETLASPPPPPPPLVVATVDAPSGDG
jgi:hypothetical protein